MSVSLKIISPSALSEAVSQLGEATAAKKCWGCGCFHNSLKAIERAYPADERPPELDAAIQAARTNLTPVRYDCLGCEVCWPPLAMNALEIDGDACPTEDAEPRAGWPPLPGSYTTHRYHAPVAVCTLTDEGLAADVARHAGDAIAIAGNVYTENLGLERIITNSIANPNIRFLIVCGPDSRQAIGHLPGQSLVALARSGIDDRMRIIGALGRRPVLKNLTRKTIEHFRQNIEVIDMIGESDVSRIIDAAEQCARRNPGPAGAPPTGRAVESLAGYVPERMTSDSSGYFVVFPDRARGVLLLEHYRNDGVLDVLIEGHCAAELYMPAIDRQLVSRLDHAAYLGRELARAEHSLRNGEPFVQDAAPEWPAPCCSSGCGCGAPTYAAHAVTNAAPASVRADATRRGRLPLWLVPAAVFVAIWLGHFAWLGFFPEKCEATPGSACTGESCDGESCADESAEPPPQPSLLAAYAAGQHQYLGFSYAASLAFATLAFGRYRRKRLCADRNLAIGGITVSGVLAVAGCFLVGCCGSPMLVVWLNLFGTKFLPFAKPLMAGVTVASLAAAWFWMRRRELRENTSDTMMS